MGAIYVGKKLGAGGFEMEVVLKQLLPEFTQQEEFIDLFLREAKLSATLDHANIVHTIDLVTAGGEYFIVMEYLPGGDLRTLLKRAKRRGKRFSPSAAIYICREVLSALAYAHVKRDFDGKPLRLIHRDVSPSNILVSYSGEVKLTDFGIAKAATHNSLFYKVKGKIGYMSPEQAKSESLDHRSDLYSLAVCMYEVLTGERLFVHAGLTTSADEIYSQPVPLISKKVPGLTQDLDAIIQKMLSIDPAKRFQTAGELNEALTRCAHRNGLLMSAPELSQELIDTCGDYNQWRGEDEDDDDLGYVPRAGTEVYDASDEDEDEDQGPLSIHSIAAKANRAATPSKAAMAALRPKTEIGKYNGVELTSIINMIDLEGGDGSKPLVDLSVGPKLDSGPRILDSGPSAVMPTLKGVGAIQDDVAATAPRPFPPAGPLSSQQRSPYSLAPQAMPPTQQPRPQRREGTRRAVSSSKKKSAIRPWMVILAIAVIAIIVTLVVAMSGPDVATQGK